MKILYMTRRILAFVALLVCFMTLPVSAQNLKTNVLYDVLLVPNIGAEFYVGGNVSLAGNWHYAWWKNDSKQWFHRTYGGDLAVRYWLSKRAKENVLSGHHVGVYGQMVTYDFLLDDKGYLGDRWNWAAGIEYGYTLPIARRLSLDFTLGLGCHWGEYKEYVPIDGHYVWQATKNRTFWGPTKAEIALVWLLGKNNFHAKKGGSR